MNYDYRKAVYEDVKTFINENWDMDGAPQDPSALREEIYYACINDASTSEKLVDSVTGYPSKTYTHSEYQAEEYLAHNWDILKRAIEFWSKYDEEYLHSIEKGPEWCDVVIRCYLLSDAIDEVMWEMQND